MQAQEYHLRLCLTDSLSNMHADRVLRYTLSKCSSRRRYLINHHLILAKDKDSNNIDRRAILKGYMLSPWQVVKRRRLAKDEQRDRDGLMSIPKISMETMIG